jgi:hypothetical protein
MNEQENNGETLSHREVEAYVQKIKDQLQRGDFSSIISKYPTLDLAIEYIFGMQQRWSPKIEGVTQEEMMTWLDEILAIIDTLPNKASTLSILQDGKEASSPSAIVERIKVTRRKFDEKPAASSQDPNDNPMGVMRD